MMEARDILKTSGFEFESFLENYGRQLFYVVSGSYTELYLGFLFLIIACTVLALQFLTQLRQTAQRYITLSMLGAKRGQMKEAMYRQVLYTFLLPMSLACISAAVGIKGMLSFHYLYIEESAMLYPMLLLFASVVIVIVIIYGAAVARSAGHEIDKLRWKPNMD